MHYNVLHERDFVKECIKKNPHKNKWTRINLCTHFYIWTHHFWMTPLGLFVSFDVCVLLVNKKNINLEEDHPMNIPTNFGWIQRRLKYKRLRTTTTTTTDAKWWKYPIWLFGSCELIKTFHMFWCQKIFISRRFNRYCT